MDQRHRLGPVEVRNPFYVSDQGHAHTGARGTYARCNFLLGHQKKESTVRYLGVEVDDALEIAERIEV